MKNSMSVSLALNQQAQIIKYGCFFFSLRCTAIGILNLILISEQTFQLIKITGTCFNANKNPSQCENKQKQSRSSWLWRAIQKYVEGYHFYWEAALLNDDLITPIHDLCLRMSVHIGKYGQRVNLFLSLTATALILETFKVKIIKIFPQSSSSNVKICSFSLSSMIVNSICFRLGEFEIGLGNGTWYFKKVLIKGVKLTHAKRQWWVKNKSAVQKKINK